MTNKTIILDGKEYELVPIEQEEKKKTKTGWERVKKYEKYFHANSIIENQFDDDFYEFREDSLFDNGNYRNDEELNRNICRAIRLRLKMLQWQALNDKPVDFSDRNKNKYYLYFDFDTNLIEISFNACCYSMNIYFSSKEKAEEALEVFRDELIWYYTEFYRRLDERKCEE